MAMAVFGARVRSAKMAMTGIPMAELGSWVRFAKRPSAGTPMAVFGPRVRFAKSLFARVRFARMKTARDPLGFVSPNRRRAATATQRHCAGEGRPAR